VVDQAPGGLLEVEAGQRVVGQEVEGEDQPPALRVGEASDGGADVGCGLAGERSVAALDLLLVLGGRVVADDVAVVDQDPGAPDLVHCPVDAACPRRLLNHVGQQLTAGRARRFVLVPGEGDVVAVGEGPRRDGIGADRRGRIGVDTHVAEVVAEEWLHECPDLGAEWFAWRCQDLLHGGVAAVPLWSADPHFGCTGGPAGGVEPATGNESIWSAG
jgi:hypothetical protein